MATVWQSAHWWVGTYSEHAESHEADLKLGNCGRARINDLLGGPQHASELKEAYLKGLCAEPQLWIQRHWILQIKDFFASLQFLWDSRETQNNK